MKKQTSTKPQFSFVIAVAPYRDAEVVQHIKALNYPSSKYEIIVKKGLNPSDNRNSGVLEAKSDIIIFIDDDALIDKDYLSNVESFFKRYPEIDIVGGPQLTPPDDAGFAKISGFALTSLFGSFNVATRYKKSSLNLNAQETDLTSANMICKKSVFNKIQFNPSLWPGEDPDFISQAKKHHMAVAYSPDICVYHRRRPTLKGLAKQIYSYGLTRPAKEPLSETLKRPYFLIPSLFMLYLLSLIATSFFPIPIIYYIPLIAYVLLSFYTSLYISVKEKNLASLFMLPFIFLAIHLSYGLGIIRGILKKI